MKISVHIVCDSVGIEVYYSRFFISAGRLDQ